ncbi:TorD/DmsD family molecular chaperone [Vibrio proteolyticus]
MDIPTDNQTLHREIYLMLASLFRQAPSEAVIDFLVTLDIEAEQSNMQKAWLTLKHAASNTSQQALEDEYQSLFIGIGRGEVVPFASWHLTGSLMEKPLAEIRHDLVQLGFEREADVKEPEDHIAALCEVMALMTDDHDATLQQAFFNKHLSPWTHKLTGQMKEAQSADFYRAVAELADAFFNLEAVRFSENIASSRNKSKIDVKNVTDSLQ